VAVEGVRRREGKGGYKCFQPWGGGGGGGRGTVREVGEERTLPWRGCPMGHENLKKSS